MTDVCSSQDALSGLIKKMLDDAVITKQVLPLCPEIKLWLVDPEPMRRRFSGDEILSIQRYPAYWAFCWASGQVLARHILDNPGLVAGKKVMDFGAGSGVVGIAASMAGAEEVIFCDIDKDALLACEANADLNEVKCRLHEDFCDFAEPLDLLVAADVLYDKANLPLLDRFLAKSLNVLVADSRIKNFSFPPYQVMGCQTSSTVPDLDELGEFRQVNLYRAGVD